uniref:Uncharacterized protein n=2 Tax=Noctiluca scintillans TaxID=2966 RepID=A0A7S0ZS82_NOCSC|mmetsp:Transcript_16684/g.45164  ORF Transcript_16684/g.45164 Transcript_16684/m.45164 type:complete len:226 (+) Transcript_16684:51-728(+)
MRHAAAAPVMRKGVVKDPLKVGGHLRAKKVSARRRRGACGRMLLAPVAQLMRCVLELAADDPQFARLGATAELIVHEGRSSSWSNPEMEAVRAEVRRREDAWQMFTSGKLLSASSEDMFSMAAHHLVLREMVIDVRDGQTVPEYGAIIMRVAHSLLGVRFVCQNDLEDALCHMLGCNSGGELLAPLAQAGLVLAGLADQRTAIEEEDAAPGGVSRAAALVASMLS